MRKRKTVPRPMIREHVTALGPARHAAECARFDVHAQARAGVIMEGTNSRTPTPASNQAHALALEVAARFGQQFALKRRGVTHVPPRLLLLRACARYLRSRRERLSLVGVRRHRRGRSHHQQLSPHLRQDAGLGGAPHAQRVCASCRTPRKRIASPHSPSDAFGLRRVEHPFQPCGFPSHAVRSASRSRAHCSTSTKFQRVQRFPSRTGRGKVPAFTRRQISDFESPQISTTFGCAPSRTDWCSITAFLEIPWDTHASQISAH